MYLFELFGLGETLTYVLLAVVAVLVIGLIALLCVASSKSGKKKESSKTSDKTLKKEPIKVQESNAKKPVESVKVVEEKKEPVVVKVEEPVKEETKENKVEDQEPVKVTVIETKVDDLPEDVNNEVQATKEADVPKNRYSGKYVILSEAGVYRYRLKASNGEALVLSEPYSTEKACRAGIETLKRNIETLKVDIVEDKHGLFHFVLITKQGRVLAQSANYKTSAAALSASQSYKRFALTDNVDEDVAAKTHLEAEIVDVQINAETTGKYEIKEENGEFEYILKASNGRVICSSQVYKSSDSCKQAMEKFRELVYEGDFFIFKDKNGNYQFKLYNKQKRLVMAGEVYDSKQLCISAIESIKRFAKYATLAE